MQASLSLSRHEKPDEQLLGFLQHCPLQCWASWGQIVQAAEKIIRIINLIELSLWLCSSLWSGRGQSCRGWVSYYIMVTGHLIIHCHHFKYHDLAIAIIIILIIVIIFPVSIILCVAHISEETIITTLPKRWQSHKCWSIPSLRTCREPFKEDGGYFGEDDLGCGNWHDL